MLHKLLLQSTASVNVPAVWTIGNNMNSIRGHHASAGTLNAGLAITGHSDGGYATNTCEEYDGIGWAYGGNSSVSNALSAGCGKQTAALNFGGYAGYLTEEYDGTAWSRGGNLTVGRSSLGGCGTQTAGLSFGNSWHGESSYVTEEYNGNTWSRGGNLNIGRDFLGGGVGTQTAGLSFGGFDQNGVAGYGLTPFTEEYDGTTWFMGGNLLTARRPAGAGTQTAGLAIAGSYTNVTEEYNGTSWYASSPYIAVLDALSSCGSKGATLAFGGHNGVTYVTTTVEFS